jgi:UDP-2,3-diacylglucosamine pyrophosphatase LpxH
MRIGDPDIDLIGKTRSALLDCVVISDLHLGAEVCQAAELERFLDWVVDNSKALIINGDIFDDLNFKRLKRHHFNCLRIIRRNTDRQDFRVIWMRGNHDGPAGIISHIVGVEILDEYVFDNGKIKLWILHGDQFDAVVSDHPIVTNFFSALFRLISRVVPLNLARLIRRLSKKFQRNSVIVKNRALAEARRRGIKAVTCGHTHKMEDAFENGIRFINTGTWTEKTPCPYLWIEGEKMGLSLWPEEEMADRTNTGPA